MSEETIVVGVDGSPASRSALEFAVAEAGRRRVPLRVVSAVVLPEFWGTGAYVPGPPADEMVEAVRAEVERFVAEVLADTGEAGAPTVRVDITPGRPGETQGEILVAAADGAELLIVGHRGRGSVASVVLGSVGLYCVLHAQCPVTVVPR